VIILAVSIGPVFAQKEDYTLIGIYDYSAAEQYNSSASHPKDPWEKTNRKIFKFNDKLDKAILKPLAKGYRKVVPSPARKGIRNVFNHLDDLFVISNNVLQAKPQSTLTSISRFLFNTTFGVLGIFDVATHLGLPKQNEDFGQTLGKWGVSSGPYFVTPVFGPATLRSFTGEAAHLTAGNNAKVEGHYPLSATKNMSRNATRNAYYALELIDKRESYVDAEEVLDTFVIDRYSAVRDAYLQQREYLVHDGEVAESSEFDAELEDEEDLVDSELDSNRHSAAGAAKTSSNNKNADVSLEAIIEDDEELLE